VLALLATLIVSCAFVTAIIAQSAASKAAIDGVWMLGVDQSDDVGKAPAKIRGGGASDRAARRPPGGMGGRGGAREPWKGREEVIRC
jgi:hypothetical protein